MINFKQAHRIFLQGEPYKEDPRFFCGKKCDVRSLCMTIDFFLLNKEQAESISHKFLRFVQDFWRDSFVTDLAVDGKMGRRQPLSTLLQNQMDTANLWGFYGFANVKGPEMCKPKDIKVYSHKVDFEIAPILMHRHTNNFIPFFHELFPNGRPAEDEELIKKIYEIFYAEGKALVDYNLGPDANVWYSAGRHRKLDDRHHGRFYIEVMFMAIEDCVDEVSEVFADFIRDVAEEYQNVNGHIMLQPTRYSGNSPYLRYFHSYGGDYDYDEDLFDDEEGQKYSYLQGVEWANVMSPLVLERGNDWENVPAGIQTSKLKNALYVQSEVPISQYDVPQAILLKEYLLPGLYPGRSARSIRRVVFPYDGMIGSAGMFSTNAPRHEWEIVPVLPGEIHVCYTDLVFMAKNCT